MKIARTNSLELSPQQIMNSLEEKTQVSVCAVAFELAESN